MSKFILRRSCFSALALAAVATLGLSGCAPQAIDAIPAASVKEIDSTDVVREAAAYLDSRLCVTNRTAEAFDIGPGYETQGTFGTLQVGQTKCFDSNNTADAIANVILFYANGSQILMNLENYAIGKPDFRVIDPVTGTQHVEGHLNENSSSSPFSIANHSFTVTRNKDAAYWKVFTAAVQS